MAHHARLGSKEKVRVVCRIRPQNNKELLLSTHGVCIKATSEQQLDIVVNDESHIFQFDRVFGMDSDQISVFEYTAIPLINDVLHGYNATIFAYGQTGTVQLLCLESTAFLSMLNAFFLSPGTGKTHTMEGHIHNASDKGNSLLIKSYLTSLSTHRNQTF